MQRPLFIAFAAASLFLCLQPAVQAQHQIADLNFDLTLDDFEIERHEQDQNYEGWLDYVESAFDLVPDDVLEVLLCNDTGVERSRARVVAVGETRCDGMSFTLKLGDESIPDVQVNWVGCPDYCDIEVGHYKPVPKVGMRAAQFYAQPWQRQLYAANCSVSYCEPIGAPTQLAARVFQWSAIPCGTTGSGGNGDGGSGGGAGTGQGL